jgi:hypothetical protein
MIVRTNPLMRQQNPMRTLGVLTEATVVWPGARISKRTRMAATQSKRLMERVVGELRSGLAARGYQVPRCEAAGSGYHHPRYHYDNMWVFESDASHKETARFRKIDRTPFHEYPLVKGDPDLQLATRRVFEGTHAAAQRRMVLSFSGDTPARDLQLIRQKLEPQIDTLCFAQVVGYKYSTGHKVGVAVFSAVTGHGSVPQDFLRARLTCIAVQSRQVLWEDSVVLREDPNAAPPFVGQLLRHFPTRGQPLAADLRERRHDALAYPEVIAQAAHARGLAPRAAPTLHEQPGQPEQPPRRKPGYHTHDGFFLHLGHGTGYGSYGAKGEEAGLVDPTVSGFALQWCFRAGYSVIENLGIHAELGFGGLIEAPAPAPMDKANASTIKLGAGATYHLMPLNLYFTLNGGYAHHEITLHEGNSQRGKRSTGGFYLYSAFGKEWWIGHNWAFGVGVMGTYAMTHEAGWTVQAGDVLLQFSTTYN